MLAVLLVFVSAPGCSRDESSASAAVPIVHAAPRAKLDYNRDVRPILADRCFRCHGPDAAARKRGLRLDTFEGATATSKSGARAIVPGDVAASEAARRMRSDDADEMMPPPEMHRPLSDAERETLLAWIEQGAEYAPHWAYVPPKRVGAPQLGAEEDRWCRDDIDRFVVARLASQSLEPSREADRASLLRRASLVLTGLPPTPEETAAFEADARADAYEREVDRLLASPRYGERMAADWLDVARFADTFGYQSDRECRTWPWRDWLIGAFNENLRYDEFLRDQVAGDLLPNATLDQRIATAFNRLHRQTNEGGSIDEEFRQEYVSDRVHTFGTAFLGLTIECARCHDHKYDPIPQRDYYSLCAFFGSIDEAGTYAYTTGATPPPTMRLPTDGDRAELASLARDVAAAEDAYRATIARRQGAFDEWRASATRVELAPPVKRMPLDGEEGAAIHGPTGRATLFDGDHGPSFADVPAFRRCDAYSLAFWMRTPDAKERATLVHTSNFTIESDQQGYQVMLKDGHLSWEVIHAWPGSAAAIRTRDPVPIDRWTHVVVTYDGSSRASGMRIAIDGAFVPVEVVRDHLDGAARVQALQVGARSRDLGFKGGAMDDLQVFDRALTAPEVADVAKSGSLGDATKIVASDAELHELFVRSIDDECRAAWRALRDARAKEEDKLESLPELMVMEESGVPREQFVLTRGAYDQPDRTRPVASDRAIDAVLAFDSSWPRNRLGLARWATDAGNPLVARVEVNRLWAICFGRGLVATQENFGVQGESPTHPELLDRLACDFVASGWDVKAMLRRIVLSSTFRQSSNVNDALVARDPRNELLARGPAFRLSAEALRDQALFASGLLVERLGGPSVKPWQPPGLWSDAGANAQGNGEYVPDTGESAHRRSLYTYRKRTVPPPNLQAFDAGSREQCLARRQTTDTPLQALVLLNDPVYVECARALAVRAATEAGDDPNARIDRAFRLLAGRGPREAERAALRGLYDAQVAAFAADPAGSKSVVQRDVPDAALAALTLTCSTMMASDAAVTIR